VWGFAAGDRKHSRVEIDPNDIMPAPGEFNGYSAGATAGIKDRPNAKRGYKSDFTVDVLPSLLQGSKARIIGLSAWDVCRVEPTTRHPFFSYEKSGAWFVSFSSPAVVPAS
jgi:hypothetical protein